MKNNNFKKIIMSSLIVAVITAGNAGLAQAATGDIMNKGNGMIYTLSQPGAIKALIADIKNGGNDVFLKEDIDGKYYDPAAKLKAQQDEVLAQVKAGSVPLTDIAAIKAYITAHATAIITAVKVKTDLVPRQAVDITTYVKVDKTGPVLTSSPYGVMDNVKRTITVTSVNGKFTVPSIGTLSFDTKLSPAGVVNTADNTYITLKKADGTIIKSVTTSTPMEKIKTSIILAKAPISSVFVPGTVVASSVVDQYKDAQIFISDATGNTSIYTLKIN